MKKSIVSKCLIIIGTVAVSLLCPITIVWAQNFASSASSASDASPASPTPAAATNSETPQALTPSMTPPEDPQTTTADTKDDTIPPEVMHFVTELNVEGSSTYTLGPTDVIDIAVQRHPEVSGQFMINKEGKIQYQFVGDIFIANMTKDQAKELITQRLSEYIINPEVTVKIAGYNSKVVYVIGEVGTPGKIFMQGDTITVREALVQSGLPLLSASTRKCPLITPSADGKPKKIDVNVFVLLYEGDLRENLIMKPGDTLYVPATVLSKAMRVISPVAQPVGTTAATGRTVMTGF